MQIKTTVKAVEFLLIKSELEAIDVKLLSAETTLFWNGEGMEATFLPPWVKLGGPTCPASVLKHHWSGHFCLLAAWICFNCKGAKR